MQPVGRQYFTQSYNYKYNWPWQHCKMEKKLLLITRLLADWKRLPSLNIKTVVTIPINMVNTLKIAQREETLNYTQDYLKPLFWLVQAAWNLFTVYKTKNRQAPQSISLFVFIDTHILPFWNITIILMAAIVYPNFHFLSITCIL